MPYVNSAERFGIEKGIQIGIEQGRQEAQQEILLESIELLLELKFGASGLNLMPEIRSIEDVDLLRSIHQRIRVAASPEELRTLIESK